MKYSLAVLLLKMADQTDTPFDREYAERFFTRAGQGTRNLVDFYLDVSHGHADLGDSEVFGWLDVPHTSDELAAYHQQVIDDETKRLNDENNALPDEHKLSPEEIKKKAAETAHSRRRGKIKEWAREAAAAVMPEPVDLNRFVNFVAVFSAPLDYFGSTDGVVVNHNPPNEELNSVELTGVAHEVGHGLGFTHSHREQTSDDYGAGSALRRCHARRRRSDLDSGTRLGARAAAFASVRGTRADCRDRTASNADGRARTACDDHRDDDATSGHRA